MKASKSGGFSEQSSIKSLAQFGMILTEENKPQNHYSGGKTTKIFVPPFKIKSRTSEGEISSVKDHPSFSCKSINGTEEYNPKEINKTFTESEEDNCAQISALDSGRSKIVQGTLDTSFFFLFWQVCNVTIITFNIKYFIFLKDQCLTIFSYYLLVIARSIIIVLKLLL